MRYCGILPPLRPPQYEPAKRGERGILRDVRDKAPDHFYYLKSDFVQRLGEIKQKKSMARRLFQNYVLTGYHMYTCTVDSRYCGHPRG